MDLKRVGLAVGALATAGAIAIGVSNASAATTTASPAASGGYATAGSPEAPGASSDTPVTGDEATKASAAVTAKDSAVTVTSVRKDPDGSYDVLGTKDGAPVMFDVSADLATITQSTGGGHGGGGAKAPSSGATGSSSSSSSSGTSGTTSTTGTTSTV